MKARRNPVYMLLFTIVNQAYQAIKVYHAFEVGDFFQAY